MIDIHCHLLYGVDDGARSLEMSRNMLAEAAEQGITDMILTPHYRQEMFLYKLDDIRSSFAAVRGVAGQYKIRVYLGCEYRVDDEMVTNLKSGRCLTLAGSDWVLTEFSHTATITKIRGSLETLLAGGYTPVIAHAERYDAFAADPALLQECRNMGAMIQINADSVLGKDGAGVKKVCRQILKSGLADIVASDCHNVSDRGNHMRQCCNHITDEYGRDLAWKLFTENPLKILERQEMLQ